MKTEEIIEICKERGELDFLFLITKVVAETDSIGEGYGYCNKYTRGDFNNAERHKERCSYDAYLDEAGIGIYEIYLEHIGAIISI